MFIYNDGYWLGDQQRHNIMGQNEQDSINYPEQTKKLISFFDEVYDLINEIGHAIDGQKLDEVGIVKITYSTIVEKVARNIHGISTILRSNDGYLQNNRQPIMLLLRGIIEDMWVGAYLFRLKNDQVSFQNELNVISIQYARFSEFLIKREPYYSFAGKEFKGLSKENIRALIEEKLLNFRTKNIQVYKQNIKGETVLKSEGELRKTSNPSHLIIKSSEGKIEDWNNRKFTASLLNDIIELVGSEGNVTLQLYSYTYFLYRALSQYQHFSLGVTREVLNTEAKLEMGLIIKTIGAIYLMLNQQLSVLDLSEEQSSRLEKAFENSLHLSPKYSEA